MEHTVDPDPAVVETRRTSFGSLASAYDAARPAWPAATVDWMVGSPDRSLEVLDLGAGTGLGSRALAALGHVVLAVDPSEGMLGALDRARGSLPDEVAARITTAIGRGEDIPADDASQDAITCFQSWHWVDRSKGEPECARVVRPGGWLAMGWHCWSPDEPWLRELSAITQTPDMIWDPAKTDDARVIEGFTEIENTQFSAHQVLTVDELVLLASSWSPVAVHPERDRMLEEVGRLGEQVVAAAHGETLVFRYVTDAIRYRRLG
jgi:SAM-dependent methyltransferase